MDRVSACGAEDTSSIPVGRTFKQKPVLKKSGYFFIISRRQITQNLSLFKNPENRPFWTHKKQDLDTIFLPFSRRGFIFSEAKVCHSIAQNSAKNIKFDAESRNLYILGFSTKKYAK